MVGFSEDDQFVGMTADEIDQWSLGQPMHGNSDFTPTPEQRLGHYNHDGSYSYWVAPKDRTDPDEHYSTNPPSCLSEG